MLAIFSGVSTGTSAIASNPDPHTVHTVVERAKLESVCGYISINN